MKICSTIVWKINLSYKFLIQSQRNLRKIFLTLSMGVLNEVELVSISRSKVRVLCGNLHSENNLYNTM